MESTTLYVEKRQLVETVVKQDTEIADLKERIDHAYRLICELTADCFLESDYTKNRISEIFYGRSPNETPAISAERAA